MTVSQICSRLLFPLLLGGVHLHAQAVPAPPAPGRGSSIAEYVLGPGDQLVVRAADIDEFDGKPTEIDLHGFIDVPLIGHVKAEGLTPEQLETVLTRRLSKYVRDPVVTVTVQEFKSQPVSVVGAVNQPGNYSLNGTKTLIEVLSEAKGLSPDASNSIDITREKKWSAIPLPSCKEDSSGRFYTAEVDSKLLFDARDPNANIKIEPDDVISVPKAEMVYVVGAVNKAGAFVLSQRENMSVLQAISMAEGLDKTAAGGRAKIIRRSEDKQRTEIPVNVGKILSGKAPDVSLAANDILFVPNSAPKSASLRAVEAAIELGTGVAIYRR